MFIYLFMNLLLELKPIQNFDQKTGSKNAIFQDSPYFYSIRGDKFWHLR